MIGIVDRVNQLLTQAKRNGISPSLLRLGRSELEELKSLDCELVPSERMRRMSKSEREEALSGYYEIIRLYQSGERFMGIPIIKMEKESHLEVV